MFINIECGKHEEHIKVSPNMKVSHVLSKLKDHMEDSSLYYTLVHQKKLLSQSHAIHHDMYLDGETFKLVGRKPYIGYVRLSTKQQIKEYGFSHQKEMIRNYIMSVEGVIIAFYEEIGSARSMDIKTRPKLNEALDVCKRLNYTLVTSKVDRLCRSVDQIVDIERSHVPFEIAELGIDQSRFMLFINASVAQEESRMISERTNKAMEILNSRSEHVKPDIINDHKHAFEIGMTYWNKHPRASLTDVVSYLNDVNIYNPKTGKPYTYQMCYRIFGKSQREEKKDPMEQMIGFISIIYKRLYSSNYLCEGTVPDIIENGVRLERNPHVWIDYVSKNKTITVDKLSDIPLNSRLLEKMHNVKLHANDIHRADANMYYKILTCILPSEGKMRQSFLHNRHITLLNTPLNRSLKPAKIEVIHKMYDRCNKVKLAQELEINVCTLTQIYKNTLPLHVYSEVNRIVKI